MKITIETCDEQQYEFVDVIRHGPNHQDKSWYDIEMKTGMGWIKSDQIKAIFETERNTKI